MPMRSTGIFPASRVRVRDYVKLENMWGDSQILHVLTVAQNNFRGVVFLECYDENNNNYERYTLESDDLVEILRE